MIHVLKSYLKLIWNSALVYGVREIVFKMRENITGYRHEKNDFLKRVGYSLSLNNPISLNQKIIWKKIHDRNPLLTVTADKYKVREYIKDVLGEKKAEEVLIPLLYAGTDPADIPFDSLPKEYIIKTNHGSGGNLIVRKGDLLKKEEVIKRFRYLLSIRFGAFLHEWGYSQIKPMVLVEALLVQEEGRIPEDFKFYVFHGKCRLVHVDFFRFTAHARSLFDENWQFISGGLKYPQGPIIDKPANFNAMKELAEQLGRDFDFVRVDLYTIGGKIYFGELTHYPGSGKERFTPESLDFELGKYWKVT